jgi:acetaldehyde dehydrogenase (acetylating)
VKDIFTGKCFDNGTLCSSEQAIVADESIKDRVIEEVKSNGGYFLNETEIETLGKIVVTPNRTINPKIVGRAATVIAGMVGLRVPEGTRVLVAPLKGVGRDFPLSIEKLSPILAFYVEKDWRAACERCIELLNYGGLGHTLAIHSQNEDIIRQFGLEKPVFRIVVNSQAALGAVGYTTGLFPSMTLGCGSIGGNITSDNISPLHLMNVKRIAYGKEGWRPASGVTSSHPSHAPASPITRQDISTVVDRWLTQKGISADSRETTQPTPPPPAAASSEASPATIVPPSPAIVAFVCEEDVRTAFKKDQKIYVNAKTIITPAARDLGTDQNVLVFTK